MPSSIRHSFVVALVVAIGACAPAAPVQDTAADEAAIDGIRAAWQAAYNAGDAAQLASLYESDAVSMPSYSPAITGAAAVQAQMETEMAQMHGQISATGVDTMVMGDWAVHRGTFSMTMPAMGEGAEPMTENGKYIVVLHRQADGSWKIAYEMSNADQPPPGMAMPGMPMMEGDGKMGGM